MKKTILVAACVAVLSAFATPGGLAQGTGPAPQQDTVSKDKMAKDGMKRGHGNHRHEKGLHGQGTA